MFPLETLIFELIVLAILNYIGPHLGRHFLKADAFLSKIIFMVAQEFSPSDERGCEVCSIFRNNFVKRHPVLQPHHLWSCPKEGKIIVDPKAAGACLVTAQSCLTLCNSMDCSPPGSSAQWDSPGKKTGVGCHALLQELLPTQGLKAVSCIADRFFTVWTTRETLSRRHLGPNQSSLRKRTLKNQPQNGW